MPSIPLFYPVILPEMEVLALEVLRSRSIASGEYIDKFEGSFGQLIGQKNVVSTDNMTSSIQLALRLSNVLSGDEVIASPFACMSTNSAIALIGAIPIWVDNDIDSIFLDPKEFELAITAKTKAAIVYHLAGYPGHISAIAKICKRRGIKLIEDCNNALMAETKSGVAGSFGDFSIYSFYPNRQINATEGGALVCKEEVDALEARKLRRFGIDMSSFRNEIGEINSRSDIQKVGGSHTLNNLCAALAYSQIPSVRTRINVTRSNADILFNLLKNELRVKIVEPLPGSNPSYWTFLIKLENREKVIKSMKAKDIHVSSLHQRTDVYSCFKVSSRTELPNINKLQAQLLGLPCGWWLTEKDLDKIVRELKKSIDESE